jgi:hypothetical protein
MFTFRCPACGKLHNANGDFVAAFEARCLRCGDTIDVTADLVRAAQTALRRAPAGAGTGALPADGEEGRVPLADGVGAAAAPAEAGGPALDDTLPLAEDGEAPPGEGTGRPRKGPGLRRRRMEDEGPRGPRPINYGREEDEGPTADDEDASPPGLYQEPVSPEPVFVPDAGPWYKRPVIWVGIAAAVMLLAGGAATAYFLTAGKAKATKKEVAKTTKPVPKPTTTAKSTAKAPEPNLAAVETPKPHAGPDVVLSAPRLAAELAANPGLADVKYKGKLLEVSGLFDGAGTRSKPGPAGTHAFFRADGAKVSADLTISPTKKDIWQRLTSGEPITVRGVYDADGVLRRPELQPLTPPADADFRGKEVELVGYVDAASAGEDSVAAFPTIRLEPETFSPVDVECLFRKSDDAEVKKTPPGTLVTIRGTSSGRRWGENHYHVRLDNCQFVTTTAPTPPAVRLDVAQYLRLYAEDLRRDLLPPAGSEERLDVPLTATQLARDCTADRQAVEKYRGRVLTVWGRLQERSRYGRLLLEGDDTDKAFRILCRFSGHHFRQVGDGAMLRVRGLCTGMSDGATLRLENCEPFDPVVKDPRRLTADYLPHVPGRVLTYDVAAWPADGGKPTAARENFVEGEGGLIETVVTLKGTLTGSSLFAPGEQARWVKKARKVRVPGDVYFRRQSGTFIEVGHRVLNRDRQWEVVWEPVLKVGARQGEAWTWAYGDMDHTYTVEKFEQRDGRSAAVVGETVVVRGDDRHPYVVRHVYVRDVGEVGRQDGQQLTKTDRKVTAEKKLVEQPSEK